MPTLPKLIRLHVDHANPKQFTLEIDGEAFPYFIAEDGIQVDVAQDRMPGVRVSLIADRVEVVNDWTAVSDAEKAAG